MDPRWQPNLGPVAPEPTLEACDLLAAGWAAEPEECWISGAGHARRMVSLETWKALRDRSGFVPPKLQKDRP